MKKNILKIMLGSIILEVILVCLFILIGNFDYVSLRALGSVAIIFGYSIPCLFYSKIYDDKKYKNIAIIGASTVCIAALISILVLWNVLAESVVLGKMSETFNVIIWMLVFISSILSFVSVNKLLDLFKKISISLISLLSFVITLIIWTEYNPEGFVLRLCFILLVLTFGAFACTLILIKIYKKEIEVVEHSKNKNEIPNEAIINSTQTINFNENIEQDITGENELLNKNNNM